MDPANLPSNPDENGAGAILGGTLFVVTLATIVVLARLYVRIFIIRGTGWDVSLILTSYFACFFFAFTFCLVNSLQLFYLAITCILKQC